MEWQQTTKDDCLSHAAYQTKARAVVRGSAPALAVPAASSTMMAALSFITMALHRYLVAAARQLVAHGIGNAAFQRKVRRIHGVRER